MGFLHSWVSQTKPIPSIVTTDSHPRAWNFIGFLGLVFCYHPPPRHYVDGMSSMDILKQIDYMGAFLSFGGVALFLVGLQAGGYQYPWRSGRVLGPLISGIIMILAFPIWEWKGTKKPMVPADIFRGQKVVAISLIVVFIAGEWYEHGVSSNALVTSY